MEDAQKVVKKVKNLIKNLDRDVRGYEAVIKDPKTKQYGVRRARAEKIAVEKTIGRLRKTLG